VGPAVDLPEAEQDHIAWPDGFRDNLLDQGSSFDDMIGSVGAKQVGFEKRQDIIASDN
jgi:hypothetical protein